MHTCMHAYIHTYIQISQLELSATRLAIDAIIEPSGYMPVVVVVFITSRSEAIGAHLGVRLLQAHSSHSCGCVEPYWS